MAYSDSSSSASSPLSDGGYSSASLNEARKKPVPWHSHTKAIWHAGSVALTDEQRFINEIIVFTTQFQSDEWGKPITHEYVLQIIQLQPRSDNFATDARVDLWFNDRYQGEQRVIITKNPNPAIRPYGTKSHLDFTINICQAWKNHSWVSSLLP